MSISNKIVGLRAELVDDQLYEVFCFGEDCVSATIGTIDGPVAAPIFDYKIVSESEVHIDSSRIKWSNVKFVDGFIYAFRNGVSVVYKVSHNPVPKKAKYLP